jgi:hypothetical protein
VTLDYQQRGKLADNQPSTRMMAQWIGTLLIMCGVAIRIIP